MTADDRKTLLTKRFGSISRSSVGKVAASLLRASVALSVRCKLRARCVRFVLTNIFQLQSENETRDAWVASGVTLIELLGADANVEDFVKINVSICDVIS